jgi:hypothetical protein
VSTNIAIAVSLKALWARNEAPRNGRPASEAATTRRSGGRSVSAARAASAVNTGIASRRPLKASSRSTPVASAVTAATDCGPIG